MTCPQCKSEKFYVKDPEDAYDTHEFETGKNGLQFADPEYAPEISAGNLWQRPGFPLLARAVGRFKLTAPG